MKLPIITQSNQGRDLDRVTTISNKKISPFSKVLWIMTHVEWNDSCGIPGRIQAEESDTWCKSQLCLCNPVTGHHTALRLSFLLWERVVTNLFHVTLVKFNIKFYSDSVTMRVLPHVLEIFLKYRVHSRGKARPTLSVSSKSTSHIGNLRYSSASLK